MSSSSLNVLLAQPRGFCAGVTRAIDIVEKALELYGAPIYVRHEIVHNKRVVDTLKAKGVIFVEELNEIPEGEVAIFSAHGVSDAVEKEAVSRGLPVIDATCPLVTKVHKEGGRYAVKGAHVVLIGHAGHPEVEGTMGRIPGGVHLVTRPADVDKLEIPKGAEVAYITQTTLSIDDTRGVIEALKSRFPLIQGPDVRDICYATQNRQTAVRKLAAKSDLILVVGAKNSSNSNRLREIGLELGKTSHLIDDANDLDPAWLEGVSTVGITAGASAPDVLIDELLAKLECLRPIELKVLDGVEENVSFKMPEHFPDAPLHKKKASS
ncbi:MAG: 4-hydroxy-3-methylbut-2-enyl diphosphate reductase [Alphaproteobacteria bacterium]|nr:4-hydroxy-3-methylbut-2-enyl diphosphate reductase [Alphaproteobacteria bacterium]